jgi:Amt family ammonium transporter
LSKLQLALLIGLVTGLVCNRAITFFKEKLGVDDTLDVFACHGVGGTLGTIFTGVFATTLVNPDGGNGLFYGESTVFTANLLGSLAVIAYSMAGTWVIFKLISFVIPIRVSDSAEEMGLDKSQHGESVLSLD